jgi:hypothetical protein
MRVAITGTSRGLGKVLKEKLCARWIPIEFNRPTYDISTKEGRKKIIDELKSNDRYNVFINNAHDGFSQVKLLQDVYNIWKDKADKYIININSRAKYPNISKGYMYSASKAALSQLSNSLRFKEDKKCRITDINPGLLESDLPSMTYGELAQWVIYLMNKGANIEIGEISLWHRTSYVDVQKQKENKLN